MDDSMLVSVIKLISLDSKNILNHDKDLRFKIKNYCQSLMDEDSVELYDDDDIDYGVSLNEFIKYFSDIKQTNAIVIDGIQSVNNHMINCLKQKSSCIDLCTSMSNQQRHFLKTVLNYDISVCTACGASIPCVIFSLSKDLKDLNYINISLKS